MADDSQITVNVSASTRSELDRFTEQRGLKKNFVVEQALLFFMQANRALPDEAFTPTKIVLSNRAFDKLAKLLGKPRKPTRALVELMRER